MRGIKRDTTDQIKHHLYGPELLSLMSLCQAMRSEILTHQQSCVQWAPGALLPAGSQRDSG